VYFVLILPNNYSDRKTERKKELYTTATVHHWVQQADDRTVHTNHKTQLQHIMMVYYPSVYWLIIHIEIITSNNYLSLSLSLSLSFQS